MPQSNFGWIAADNPIPGMIDAAAERYGVNRDLAHVVAQMESNYNPKADSGKAQGVMQLAPPTARELGVTDPLDPAQNIDAGVRLLKRLDDKYGGDTKLVLAAYNAGEGAVQKYGGVPKYRETENYVNLGTKKLGSANREAPANDFGWVAAPQEQAAPQAAPEMRAPLTEPPDPNAKPPGAKQPEKTFEGFVSNLGTSALNLLSPVLHPAQTVQGIAELGQAMAEKSGFKPVMGQSHMQALNALGDFYKQRYGSWQGFKDAWYNDPVGMASDLATVVSGAGLGANAAQDFIKVAGLSEHAEAVANALGKAGTAAKGGAIGMVKAIPDIPVQAATGAVVGGIGFQNPIAGAKLGALNALRKGATEGAKEALAARAQRIADALKAAEELRAGQRIVIGDRPVTPPPAGIPLSRQLGPGPMIPPAPPDASYVRGVPAQYAQPEPIPPSRQLGPGPIITPPPPDPSFVRAVPAEYPFVESPMVRAAQQAGDFTPQEQALADHVLQNVEPQPAPAAAPKPAAAELAAQLEASMRAETLTDYLVRNKIPNSMVENFGGQEWKMVADQAGVQPPTQENIQAIRSNLSQYEAAATQPSEVGKMAPAEAKADFEQRIATRTKRKGPAVATEPAPAAAPTAEAPQVPESWQGAQPPPPGPPAPTASEVRVEAFAKHLAQGEIPTDTLAGLPSQPKALLQLEELGRSLGIEGRPAPGEVQQIVDRVRQLRGEGPAAAAPQAGRVAGEAPPGSMAATMGPEWNRWAHLQAKRGPLTDAEWNEFVKLDEKFGPPAEAPQTLRSMMEGEKPAAAAPETLPAAKQPWQMSEREWETYKQANVPEFVEAGLEYKQRYTGKHETVRGVWKDALDVLENPDKRIAEWGKTYRDTVNKADAWLEQHPEFAKSHEQHIAEAVEAGKTLSPENARTYSDVIADTRKDMERAAEPVRPPAPSPRKRRSK